MRLTNTLILYKRHTSTCAVHAIRIPAAKKIYWFECDCMINIHGRCPNGDIMPRQKTGFRVLKEAEAFRAMYLAEKAGTSSVTAVHGITFTEAIKRYLASRHHQLGERTADRIRRTLERLAAYCARNNVLHLSGLTADMVERFKEDEFAGNMDTTKGIRTAQVRCFLREAFRRDWVAVALAEKVKPHHGEFEQKEPFTDEEVPRILAETANLQPADNGVHGWGCKPRTFRLLLELMLATGLRVSDAVAFNPANLRRGEPGIWVYRFTQTKTRKGRAKKVVEVYLGDSLKAAIDGCDWYSASLPFCYRREPDADICRIVYQTMIKIGKRCGIADCRPHRLRDTFAIRLLLKGIPLEDVSRLLCHSSIKTTEMYYARWTTGRQVRLQGLVAQTLLHPPNHALRD